MDLSKLVSGKRYSLSHCIAVYGVCKAKYVGDVTVDHPELGITHPAKHLFVSAYQHDDPKVGVCLRCYHLCDHEIRSDVEEIP